MAAGVATLILGTGAYRSLSDTRAAYYETSRFADIFATVTRAPKSVLAEIAAVDGVADAEARIVKIAMADIPDMRELASTMLVSLPDFGGQKLNRVHLRAGRMPEGNGSDEVLVSQGFARAHGLAPGATLSLVINGVKRGLRITGIALSPEFVYALGPGDLMPNERRFGIVWMPEEALAGAFDLEGAFSNLAVKLQPGASQDHVIERIDQTLARYGGQGAYGRSDQISHAFLDAELKQLQAMSRFLPPIFLFVSALLVNMTLARLITLEREQIGLLKALGYSSWAVARHYLAFVAVIAIFGIAIGSVAGYLLGRGLTALYAQFFTFPFLVFSRSTGPYAIAGLVTLAAASAGALAEASKAAWLQPAVAMSPPAPPRYRKFMRGALDAARYLSQSSVMIYRHLSHWPLRTASGLLGVALATAILVGSLWSFGSIEYLIDFTFHRSDRQDATITFNSEKGSSAFQAARQLPGILQAEPYRALAVKISFGHVSRRLSLLGKPQNSELSRVLDVDERMVTMPDYGIVLTRALADILGARTGETVSVEFLEGRRETREVRVSAIVESFIGLLAFMEIAALNRLAGEGRVISGVNVTIDGALRDRLFAALKATPAAGFITLQKAALQKFRETLAQNIFIMLSVYVSLAVIIAFGVIYNFARISLSEQGRELASLRVLGFTRGEVSGLLLGELAVIFIIAQPLGWLIGYGFAVAMVKGFTTEIYRVPFVIERSVYAYSSLIVAGAALLSALIVRRRVDRLDMIAVLKTRE
ncbi:MAG: FtsX-like permease family protein [Alphaproteobacteria bacterium]|nr:FtsX-like permease family protein [Alphaproteobacteria bacterium]